MSLSAAPAPARLASSTATRDSPEVIPPAIGKYCDAPLDFSGRSICRRQIGRPLRLAKWITIWSHPSHWTTVIEQAEICAAARPVVTVEIAKAPLIGGCACRAEYSLVLTRGLRIEYPGGSSGTNETTTGSK